MCRPSACQRPGALYECCRRSLRVVVGICTAVEHRLCAPPTCEYRMAVGHSPTLVGNYLTPTQSELTTVGGEVKARGELVRIAALKDQDSSPLRESVGLCHFKIYQGAMQGLAVGAECSSPSVMGVLVWCRRGVLKWGLVPPPLCDISSGCCFFTGPWTVTRSSLCVLRWVAAFCRPLRPVLLLVSFPRSWSPVVGVPALCWLRWVPFVC